MSNATNLRQTTLDTAREAALDIENAATRGVRSLSDSAHAVREQALHAASTVRDSAQAMQQRGRRYVADEPGKSVLIAVAAGVLIAGLLMLANGRRRDF